LREREARQKIGEGGKWRREPQRKGRGGKIRGGRGKGRGKGRAESLSVEDASENQEGEKRLVSYTKRKETTANKGEGGSLRDFPLTKPTRAVEVVGEEKEATGWRTGRGGNDTEGGEREAKKVTEFPCG